VSGEILIGLRRHATRGGDKPRPYAVISRSGSDDGIPFEPMHGYERDERASFARRGLPLASGQRCLLLWACLWWTARLLPGACLRWSAVSLRSG
jgi:hypothetical protein